MKKNQISFGGSLNQIKQSGDEKKKFYLGNNLSS